MSGIIGISPDMRSGVVGKPPIGNVIQIVTGSAVASSGHSGNSVAMGTTVTNPRPTHNQGVSIGTQSFTPRFSNSNILVQTNNIYMSERANASDHFHLFLQDNTASTVLSHMAMYAPFGIVTFGNHGGVCNLNHAFASWGTTARTLEFRIGTDGGTSTNFIWNPYYNSGSRNTTETGQFHWTLKEISQ